MADVEENKPEPPPAKEKTSGKSTISDGSSWEGKKGVLFSFILLICGMVASIIAQNYVRDHLNNPDNWLQGCPSGYDQECVGNGAVYRFSFALVIIFALQLIGSTVHIGYFDQLWSLKFLLFAGIVIGFYNVNAAVFDDHGYAWAARILAFFYVILQQVILIDFAYIVNDKLLTYAAADEESNKWYAVVLTLAIILFVGSYTALGIMFWQFTGCSSNDAILSLTLCLTLIATLIQVFGSEEGSILTSAIMTAYAVYVCYSAVVLNPNSSCNPTISTSYQTVSTAIGLALTVLSITWAAITAVQKIPGALKREQGANGEESNVVSLRTIFQEVSVVFILISAYYCMVLTNWATLQSSSSISNPRSGDVALWLQATAQWIAIILYSWTLVAPKLLPDRDFSS